MFIINISQLMQIKCNLSYKTNRIPSLTGKVYSAGQN